MMQAPTRQQTCKREACQEATSDGLSGSPDQGEIQLVSLALHI